MENILSLTTMPLMAARTSAPAVGAAELTPKINFGVYDPDGQYQQESGIAIEHVVITECGVIGSEEYQLSWLSGVLQDLGRYPLLKALIYFNAEEVASASVSVSGEAAHAI